MQQPIEGGEPWQRSGVARAALAGLAGLCGGLAIGTIDWSFGVFVNAIAGEFPTWSRTQISAALSWYAMAAAVISPACGYVLDAYGAWPTMCFSLVTMAVGFAVLANAQTIPVLYLAYVLIGFGYAGCGNLGPGKVVASLYPGRVKGRVMGIVIGFNNVCGLAMVQVSNALVRGYNWHVAAIAFSFLLIGLTILFHASYYGCYASVLEATKRNEDTIVADAAEVGINRNEDDDGENVNDGDREDNATSDLEAVHPRRRHHQPARSPVYLRDVVRDPVFVLSGLGSMASYYTYNGVLPSIVPALVAKGMDDSEAAHILSMVAALGLLGKLSCGTVSEYISANRAMQLCLVSQALGLFVFWAVASDATGLWIACALYGLSLGGVAALLPLVVLEIFDNESFGKIYGFVLFLFLVPSVAGPLISGWSFDNTQNYDLAFAFAAALFLVGAILFEAARYLSQQRGRRHSGGKHSTARHGTRSNNSKSTSGRYVAVHSIHQGESGNGDQQLRQQVSAIMVMSAPESPATRLLLLSTPANSSDLVLPLPPPTPPPSPFPSFAGDDASREEDKQKHPFALFPTQQLTSPRASSLTSPRTSSLTSPTRAQLHNGTSQPPNL